MTSAHELQVMFCAFVAVAWLDIVIEAPITNVFIQWK